MMSAHAPRGLQPVPDEEVIDLYGGTQHIPLYQMSGFYGKVLTPPATAPGGQHSDLAMGPTPWCAGPGLRAVPLYQCGQADSEPLVCGAGGC